MFTPSAPGDSEEQLLWRGPPGQDPFLLYRRPFTTLIAAAMTGLLLLLSGAPHSSASGQQITEYQLKAATLRYLAHNVAFPTNSFSSSNAPLVIAVLGSNPFGKTLENLTSGESVDGHPIVIRYLRKGASIDGCHIVFMCTSEAKRAAPVIAAAVGRPTLLVGEFANFTAAGGHLNYQIAHGAMQVEYNIAAAAKSYLKIPSKIQRAGVAVSSR